METMKFIIIYDTTGKIISQYASTNIVPPVGVPYLILDEYMSSNAKEYRRIELGDVSGEPNAPG